MTRSWLCGYCCGSTDPLLRARPRPANFWYSFHMRSASATAVMCWTATGASVTAAGANYGTLTPWVTTIGGLSAASPSWTNPRYEVSIMRPRPASMAAAVASGSITSIATVYDGGLFTGTPTTLVLADAAPTVAAVLAVTLGNTYDVVTLQPI